MKAHKVPATYYSGWNASGFKHSFYVFYKNALTEKGILKPYRKVETITAEHSYFMKENFYYIDLSIKGISFKLKNEISDFLREKSYKILCLDTLAECEKDEPLPTIVLDDYNKIMTYMDDIDKWSIENPTGNIVTAQEFIDELDRYIFEKVGVLIEENYFSNYLENMWGDIRNSIIDEVIAKKSDDKVTINRRTDLLEFFVVQYLRMDRQIKPKIEMVLSIAENALVDIGADAKIISALKQDGLLSFEPYFFGALLDAARGDKRKIMRKVSEIDSNYEIDILHSKTSSYLTSTNPCVYSQGVRGDITEMLFPIASQYCLRFRKRLGCISKGRYIEQTDQEVKIINASIISKADEIVISHCEYISDLI